MKKKTPAAELLIGAHTSAQGGVYQALLQGEEIGATTIQFFTANHKRWEGKEISDADLKLWEKIRERNGLKHLMSHDSFLINLGSPNPEGLHKSCQAFSRELKRCHRLQLSYLNFHPGAALDSSETQCLETIVASLLSLEEQCAQGETRLLIETTAGQGSSVGHKFEHLAYIVERTASKIPIGVCIDTCHIFSAGYDIRTKEAWEATLKTFDSIVGLKHLYALHVNDSLKPLGARKDRHACLGKGEIGIESFKAMMQHPDLRELPKYLETPEGPALWKEEIKMLREFAL